MFLVWILINQLRPTLPIVQCLASNVVDDVFVVLVLFVDFLLKVKSTQWALSFDSEPFVATVFVEIVLWIAVENNDLIRWLKIDQADGAVRHVLIFLLVFFVTDAFETVFVSF